MSSLAEKLKSAGADTVGSRLTVACTEAIRLHPNNAAEAWAHVGAIFGHEFVKGLMGDMKIPQPAAPTTTQWTPTPTPRSLAAPSIAPKPYQPRMVRSETISKMVAVVSKYKNSAGVPWSEVSYTELVALARDGVEARAILDAIPQDVPNDGRNVGQILGVKAVDQIIATARG